MNAHFTKPAWCVKYRAVSLSRSFDTWLFISEWLCECANDGDAVGSRFSSSAASDNLHFSFLKGKGI